MTAWPSWAASGIWPFSDRRASPGHSLCQWPSAVNRVPKAKPIVLSRLRRWHDRGGLRLVVEISTVVAVGAHGENHDAVAGLFVLQRLVGIRVERRLREICRHQRGKVHGPLAMLEAIAFRR